MPVQADWRIARWEDGTLIIGLSPATAIGGMPLQFQMQKRFGGISGFARRSMSSGFYGVSGMTIVDSGQGVMRVQFFKEDTSGLDFSNYVFQVTRTTSGSQTVVVDGYVPVLSSIDPSL